MIPANFPTLGAEVAAPTNPAQAAANNAASAQNGDQFAKALDKASARNNEPKTTSKDTKSAKSSKSNEAKSNSTDDSNSVDETGAKSVDEKATKSQDSSKSETSAENQESAASEPVAEPIATVTPTAVKPIDVSALLPTLTTTPATTATTATPVVDPALAVASATAPAVEDVLTPLAVTLASTSTKPAETAATATPVVADPTAAKTADPATILPTTSTADVDAPTLPTATTTTPTTPVVSTEVQKEAVVKQAGPANVDSAVANALNGVNKNQAATAPTAVTATHAPTPDAHAEPYKQIVQVVQPLRGRDGDHSITISLSPEHLGRVDVQINLQSNNISMQMNADNPQSRQMLKDSMNDLRQSLNESGLNAGSLDVGSQDAGQQSQQSAGGRAHSWDSSADIEITDEEFFSRLAATAGSAPIGDGPLDIRA